MLIRGDVAQLVEHLPEEQGVVGSTPTVTTNDFVAQLVEHFTFNEGVPSSNLGGVTIRSVGRVA